VLNKLLQLPTQGESGGGKIHTANSRYDDLIADIDESIKRMNARFDAEQESLIKQFTALETAVSGFQNTASFLSSQLASVGGLRI
jgi:flagellar capping protein FliD